MRSSINLINKTMELKSKADLDQAIARMEQLKTEQREEIVFLFKETAHSLNPVTLIKDKLSDITGPGETRNSLLTTIGGMAAGMLTKKILIGKTNNVVTSFIGNLIKTGTFSLIQGQADKISAYATAIYHNLGKNKTDD